VKGGSVIVPSGEDRVKLKMSEAPTFCSITLPDARNYTPVRLKGKKNIERRAKLI
jgi:hypothetical protein